VNKLEMTAIKTDRIWAQKIKYIYQRSAFSEQLSDRVHSFECPKPREIERPVHQSHRRTIKRIFYHFIFADLVGRVISKNWPSSRPEQSPGEEWTIPMEIVNE
jgi:hypothetical protein